MVQMPTDIVKELIIVRTAVNPKPNLDFTWLIFAKTEQKYMHGYIVPRYIEESILLSNASVEMSSIKL